MPKGTPFYGMTLDALWHNIGYWFSRIMWLPAAPALRKTRAELMKEVDAEYYGYRDEDDGVLLPLESQYEKQGEIILLWF